MLASQLLNFHLDIQTITKLIVSNIGGGDVHLKNSAEEGVKMKCQGSIEGIHEYLKGIVAGNKYNTEKHHGQKYIFIKIY